MQIFCLNASAADVPTLSGGTSSEWWDANAQELNFPPAGLLPNNEQFLDDRHRLPNDPPPPPVPSNWSFWDQVGRFLFSAQFWISMLFIGMIIAILAIVIYQAKKVYRVRSHQSDDQTHRLKIESAKILDLPFEVESTKTGLLETAKQLAAKGDFRAAIIYLFSHTLVELDQRKLLLIRRGKTNRMYLRELRKHSQIASRYSRVMEAFERAFFGKHLVTREEFADALQASDEATQLAAQVQISNLPAGDDQPGTGTPAIRATLSVLIVCVLQCFSGCGSNLPKEIYGPSNRSSAESIASFSAFRSMINSSDRRTTETRVLSQRLDKVEGIVWTPTDMVVPNAESCSWIQNWLEQGTDRVFVFVGRDYSPSPEYWQDAADAADDIDRLAFKNMAAVKQVDHDQLFMTSSSLDDRFARWFVERARIAPFESVLLKSGSESFPISAAPLRMSVRTELVPITDFSRTELRAEFDAEIQEHIDADVNLIVDVEGPEEEYYYDYDEDYYDDPAIEYESTYVEEMDAAEVDEDSFHSLDDLVEAERDRREYEDDSFSSAKDSSTPKASDAAAEEKSIIDSKVQLGIDAIAQLKTTPLLVDDRGRAIVFEVTNPDAWTNGRVIVVTNASLFCNYALADPARRAATQALIEKFPPKARVAFMLTPLPLVRNTPAPSDLPFGLKLFVTYPLNLILMHLIFAGLVTLIAMWPIFGRVQSLQKANDRDFGKHVEALGFLLRQTRDFGYARHLIRRYFVEQRKELQSEWAKAAEVRPPAPQSPQPNRDSPTVIAETGQRQPTKTNTPPENK